VVKERARYLREKGEAALRRHLDSEVGHTRSVLVETDEIGRTAQFTPVRIGRASAGSLVDVNIAGHDGRHLIAA
jgi:threonylcarbamoyladenosine tRNA methylthiotransferase MtaB